MKHFILLFLFLYLSSTSFCQLSKEFKKIDSQKSYKNVEFGCSIVDAKTKMGLTLIKGTNGFQYSILNKEYLSIGNFIFNKGEAGFLFKKLKTISLESRRSDVKYFQELLAYLRNTLGDSQFKDDAYYWIGENIGYSLFRNTTNNYITVVISSMND